MAVGVATEPETMAELISACAELPASVVQPATEALVVEPSGSVHWLVSDACLAQVRDLDDYGG